MWEAAMIVTAALEVRMGNRSQSRWSDGVRDPVEVWSCDEDSHVSGSPSMMGSAKRPHSLDSHENRED